MRTRKNQRETNLLEKGWEKKSNTYRNIHFIQKISRVYEPRIKKVSR